MAKKKQLNIEELQAKKNMLLAFLEKSKRLKYKLMYQQIKIETLIDEKK